MAILVIDDEPGVRVLLRAMLADAGNDILQAGGASEALQILQARNGAVELVVTDVVMPGMDGFALAQEIWRLYPDVKVLFVSGFVDAEAVRSHLSRNCGFLPKPFQRAELLRVVEDLAGRPLKKVTIRAKHRNAPFRHRPVPRFPVLAARHLP